MKKLSFRHDCWWREAHTAYPCEHKVTVSLMNHGCFGAERRNFDPWRSQVCRCGHCRGQGNRRSQAHLPGRRGRCKHNTLCKCCSGRWNCSTWTGRREQCMCRSFPRRLLHTECRVPHTEPPLQSVTVAMRWRSSARCMLWQPSWPVAAVLFPFLLYTEEKCE